MRRLSSCASMPRAAPARPWVARVARLAMAAHVPEDPPIAVGERGDLPVPHPGGRAIAVRQQEGRAGTVAFIVNGDPVAVDRRHDEAPVAGFGGSGMIVEDPR